MSQTREYPEEEKIVALFWARSEQAIIACQRQYHGLLQHLARNITGNDQDAEECVSDTYFKLWNSIPPQRPVSLKAYALRILRNCAIDRQRQMNRRSSCQSLDQLTQELGDCIPADGGTLTTLALRDQLNRFLSEQSRENRILFVRRYFQGEPLDTLARQAGLSEGAVKMRLTRMREKLGKLLEES